MAPHAGYVFSGGVAGAVFASVEVPAHVIVMGPNHTGYGPRISVMNEGSWRLPGAEVEVDGGLADAILAAAPAAVADREAHRLEHAIEVELPFLVARRPDVRVVPIVLGRLSADQAVDFGRALHQAVREHLSQPGGVEDASARPEDQVLVVASSDMSHYLPDQEARRVDRVALDALLGYDADALYRTVVEHEISMCGFVPATAMLAYARAAGAQPPELLAYATSAEAFGDTDRVVGYAGVVLGARGS